MRLGVSAGFILICTSTALLLFVSSAHGRSLSYSERVTRNAHRTITATQNCQRKLGRSVTEVKHRYRFQSVRRRRYVFHRWKRRNEDCWEDYRNRPRSYGYGAPLCGASCIQCESGGNPNAWNAAGYWGLYQFDRGTWIAHGGSPSEFGNAPAWRQHQIARNVRYDAWPNC